MQDDERRDGDPSGLLDDIRRIVAEEARPRPPAAFEPASQGGVLSLTPEMRESAAGLQAPRGPLPPAEDEEPPLVLTRRVDQPRQPFGTGSAAKASTAGASGGHAEPEPRARTVEPEMPAPQATTPPPSAPEPEVFASMPPTEGAEPAEAPSAVPEDARTERPRTAAPSERLLTAEPSERSPGIVAARVPRFGAPYGQAAAPQDVRRAFASDNAQGPIPASGLPRSREELLALTRDVIREELAGPLGERISQNIKLLIEREVRRAVAELERDKDQSDR